MPIPLHHFSRRLVLRSYVTNEEIHAAARLDGWTFDAEIQRDPDRGICYEVKWRVGDTGSIHYVVDEFADVLYMVAVHPDAAARERLLERIAAQLPTWKARELLTDAYCHVYPAGWAKSLLWLGVGAPLEADEEIADHLRFSLGHKEASVRLAAVRAMVYTGWPELRAALEHTASADADPQVAREAGKVAELLENRPPPPREGVGRDS